MIHIGKFGLLLPRFQSTSVSAWPRDCDHLPAIKPTPVVVVVVVVAVAVLLPYVNVEHLWPCRDGMIAAQNYSWAGRKLLTSSKCIELRQNRQLPLLESAIGLSVIQKGVNE